MDFCGSRPDDIPGESIERPIYILFAVHIEDTPSTTLGHVFDGRQIVGTRDVGGRHGVCIWWNVVAVLVINGLN